MRNRFFARLASFMVVLGLSSAAAQETPTAQVHAATRLAFPADIGGARMTRWNDYGQSAGQPGLGFSYHYSVPGRLVATVYVYNLNQRVPAGADNPVVMAQFQQAYGDIEKVAQTGRYRDLQKISGPAPCPYGPLTLRCATFSAIVASNNQPVFARVMVTGYREHFVKLRLDWGQRSLTEGDVDRFVRGLIEAMVR